MSHRHVMHTALHALEEARKRLIKAQIEKAGDTIKTCSIAATIGGVGAGLLLGVGGAISTVACVSAIWGMYIAISKDLGKSISTNLLKSLVSALLTNIIASGGLAAVLFVGGFFVNLVPGLQPFSSALVAMASYMAVFISGILYIKVLTKVMKATGTFDISTFEAKN